MHAAYYRPGGVYRDLPEHMPQYAPSRIHDEASVRELNRSQGLTVFLVEQNAFGALKLANRGYVLVNGNVTMSGTGQQLLADPEVRAAYLEGGRH